jgi:glutamate-1-semialdehyde 2,1-aminomutase
VSDDARLNGWARRAARVIPGGASTGSKRPAAMYGTALADDLPTHVRRAWGCRVETADGRELVDLTMALGAVALGYADAEVTAAVQEAAVAGPVGGGSPLLEIEVAERLTEVIPCAEQVRFLKSGAEATAAAVRLARAATGRSVVIASGYFGWHDWSNPGPGVPDATTADVHTVPFDDVPALDAAVAAAGDTLAAIVLEPLVHHVASAAWLQAARAHCDRLGAVLVFDEIKTAFRVRTGGVQSLRDVHPDLATIGKAIANGYPLAAVVGRRAIMETPTWISSTLASEMASLAAARAVLDRHARQDVCGELARIGERLQAAVRDALAPYAELGVQVEGPGAMCRLAAEHEPVLDALVAETVRRGVLLKRGAYQFAALAHDDAAVALVHDAVAAAAAYLVTAHPDLPARR